MNADPEIDPYVLVSGSVRNLRRQRTHVNPLKVSGEQQLSSGIAMLQSAEGVAGSVNSLQFASYEGDPVEAFMMNVGDLSVSGYFWNVGFNEGEDVEVVGRIRGNRLDAVAVTKPKERLIWIRPHHVRGSGAFVKAERRKIFAFMLAVDLLVMLACIGVAMLRLDQGDRLGFVAMGFCVSVISTIAAFFFLRSPRAIADLSKEVDTIARMLKLSPPEMADFEASTRAARRSGRPHQGAADYYY